MTGLADQLHEAMDPDVTRTKEIYDAANKEWGKQGKAKQKAGTILDILERVTERVERYNYSLDDAWDWVLSTKKPQVVGYLASHKGLLRYTRKSVKAHEVMPTKAEIALAKKEFDALDAIYERGRDALVAARKAHDEATGAARRAAKRKKNDALGLAICQSCFGGYNYDRGGTLVRHGWREAGGRRKGHYGGTWHSGECPGTGAQPFQVTKTLTEHEIKVYDAALKSMRLMQANGVATEIELLDSRYADGNGYVLSTLRTIPKEKRDGAVPKVIEAVISGVTNDRDLSKSMAKRWKRDEKWITRTTWPKKAN